MALSNGAPSPYINGNILTGERLLQGNTHEAEQIHNKYNFAFSSCKSHFRFYFSNLSNNLWNMLLVQLKEITNIIYYIGSSITGRTSFRFQVPISNINERIISQHEHSEKDCGNLTASCNVPHQIEIQLQISTSHRYWGLWQVKLCNFKLTFTCIIFFFFQFN